MKSVDTKPWKLNKNYENKPTDILTKWKIKRGIPI